MVKSLTYSQKGRSASGGHSVFRHLDWLTLILYLMLVTFGVISIYAASYDFDNASIFSFSEFSGKQVTWICLAFFIGLIILLSDSRIYETYAYPIYFAILLLLIVTIFIAPDTKGSRSWLVFGPVSLQPAEFAKFATALALAKLFSSYNFNLNASAGNYVKALAIIFVPVLLIMAQKETGSALVYLSLFFVLYREGMSGLILGAAFFAVVLFVVSVKYAAESAIGIPLGEFICFILIMVLLVTMLAGYVKDWMITRNVVLWFAGTALVEWLLSLAGWHLQGYVYFGTVIGVAVGYCLFEMLRVKASKLMLTVGAVLVSVAFLFSVGLVFNKMMQPHQQKRIKVVLGIVDDPRGDSFNVNQSKIAIGSGGTFGKGFLKGTQTKLKYVPEQHTDFIFCTIGEEEGFVGTTSVVVMFLLLILRVISLAERQPTAFGRVYAYCVASYLIFHFCINIGMVIGLCPVIGIPLPFFSYGGSSLWGFTILLFILLRIDAARASGVTH